ncbi:uncharacterized protein [Heterodontus francisci]|uniref:uncharacterized protein n=1 Tax=Heterodontus francisci TaxID=7792 RepID=UPI00355BFDD4
MTEVRYWGKHQYFTTAILNDMYLAKWESMLQPKRAGLITYNESPNCCVGVLSLKCRYGSFAWSPQVFYVVGTSGSEVAGLSTRSEFQIVTIPEISKMPKLDNQDKCDPIESIQDLQLKYPDKSDTVGSFIGDDVLHLNDNTFYAIDPPLKCSVHIKDKLKGKFDMMERQGIIHRVQEHTNWCRSITTMIKKDGTIRVCLDPRRLNQTPKRCPHKIPTLEELNPRFAGA